MKYPTPLVSVLSGSIITTSVRFWYLFWLGFLGIIHTYMLLYPRLRDVFMWYLIFTSAAKAFCSCLPESVLLRPRRKKGSKMLP